MLSRNRDRIVICGASGLVGDLIRERLLKSGYKDLILLASDKYEKNGFNYEKLDDFKFKNGDIVFTCMDNEITKKYADRILKSGARIIDKSSCFRMQNDVPLIVPEVNKEVLDNNDPKIIASPNCIAIPLSMVLNGIKNNIDAAVISTYQSISGAGKIALNNFKKSIENGVVPNNMHSIPHIGGAANCNMTGEEEKVIFETKKILMKNDFDIDVTCVRVPVMIGHSMSINIKLKQDKKKDDFINDILKTDNIVLKDNFDNQQSSFEGDKVYIGRIRKSKTRTYNMWVYCNNLQKGAAVNAISIYQHLTHNRYLYAS